MGALPYAEQAYNSPVSTPSQSTTYSTEPMGQLEKRRIHWIFMDIFDKNITLPTVVPVLLKRWKN